MKIQIKTSRSAALELIAALDAAVEENDGYSLTIVSADGSSGSHYTTGGNVYSVYVSSNGGILIFEGSRTSLRDGSLAIEIRPDVSRSDRYKDGLTLRPGQKCRVNGFLGMVEDVKYSLPAACPMADDAWADDRDIFAWLADELVADAAEAKFEALAAHVSAAGHCGAVVL